MNSIDSISSFDGRKILRGIYNELKYEKQFNSITIILTLWKICVFENELKKYSKYEVRVLQTLGFWRGTFIWMEEVINRYFFNSINSFVYFGAAILLVLIGVRRFSDSISDDVIIFGVAFEALMLFFMFIVMLFSPSEITDNMDESDDNELLSEVGEIGRDFAAVVIQLEQMSSSLNELVINQTKLLENVSEIVKNSADAASPNPEMIGILKDTNFELKEFKSSLENLKESSDTIRKEHIEAAVRREIEKIIVKNINK